MMTTGVVSAICRATQEVFFFSLPAILRPSAGRNDDGCHQRHLSDAPVTTFSERTTPPPNRMSTVQFSLCAFESDGL